MNSDVSEGGVGITEARTGDSKGVELMSSITDAWLDPVRSFASGRLAGLVGLVVLASTVVGDRVGRIRCVSGNRRGGIVHGRLSMFSPIGSGESGRQNRD